MPNIRELDSLSVQGCVIQPFSSVLLKPCKKQKSIKDGFLRAHNVSSSIQMLMPAKVAQAQWSPNFVPVIMGDDKKASLPMAWDNPSIRFEIISLPNSILPNGSRVLLEPDKYTARGSSWTSKELVCAVQEPDGSPPPGPNNPNNYMGFDRTRWKVFQQETMQGVISNVELIFVHGRFQDSYTTADNEIAYIFETLGKRIAFVCSLTPAAAYISPGDTLGIFLDSIGTSGQISLLQKAIRRRPVAMVHPETLEEFETIEIVRRIAQRHCRGKQPGFFLPRIGKFVSGFQHFMKRLFIIAAEDSKYEQDPMIDMSMTALLASLQPLWSPSENVVDRIVLQTLNLLSSGVTSRYKTDKDWPVVSDFKRSIPALVQQTMGGMTGDQRMLRWLALHPEDCNSVGSEGELVNIRDPLDIYCDQHQDGRLACLLEQTESVPRLLSKAFHAVSGFNTRREAVSTRTAFQQQVFDGLRASSKMLRGIVPCRSSASGSIFSYSLPEASIAGMVGTIEIAHDRHKYFVTVSTRNIHQFIVIPKPSRDNTKGLEDITPDVKENVIEKVKEMLTKGIKAKSSFEEQLKGKIIFYQQNSWIIDGKPWSSQRNRRVQLTIEPDWSRLTSDTIEPVSWSSTFGQAKQFSKGARQFALGRMAGYEPLVTCPKISREGIGTDEALTGLEGESYQFLSYLSKYFPDALWPSKKAFAFETRSVPFRKLLCDKLRESISFTCDWPEWTSQLTLKPEQSLALSEMLDSHSKGMASFLWMLVGQGKTLTVLKYLQETRDSRFIIWTCPKTAVRSIAVQIKEVGWNPVQLYPSAGLLRNHNTPDLPALHTKANFKLHRKFVHIIEHDHLRNSTDMLANQMNQTAFVFDEVHKVMQSATKRTASALRLARIARQLVALTGTPIVDKSGYGLMQWLRLCVPFPVTAANFWVAANSMISPLNTGDVVTVDVEIQAPESDNDKAFFKQNFPSRPPWHGMTSQPSPQQWIDMRHRTNQIVTQEMVRLAVECYNRHPQNWRDEHFQAVSREKTQASWWLQNSQRPLMVAASSAHVVQIADLLLAAGVSAEDILCVGGTRPNTLSASIQHNKTVHLSENAVINGEVKPYKIVIVPKTKCTGYSMTWMTCMITGSYPSNQADRTQMRGRINRLDCQRLYKQYFTVLAGTTTITYHHQKAAAMMEKALRQTASKRAPKKKQKTTLKY